jgi:hypothetical protein
LLTEKDKRIQDASFMHLELLQSSLKQTLGSLAFPLATSGG